VPFGFLVLITGQGADGLLDLALGSAHHPFDLISPTAIHFPIPNPALDLVHRLFCVLDVYRLSVRTRPLIFRFIPQVRSSTGEA
jgi:hypothetical protein